jgi:uncharacterized protein YdaU (DUF1376 family)
MTKKDTFYFSHDFNARMDDKIKELMYKLGVEGYGIYWILIEDLYNNANALRTNYERIAYDLRLDKDKIKSVVEDFNLFEINDEIFSSKSVKKRLDERNDKSIKAQKSANSRWKNANALLPHYDSNAIKEIKGKEIKGKEIKGNNFIENINYSDVVGENSDVKKNDDEFNEKVKKWRIECSKFLKDEIFKKNFCNKEGLELPTLEELMNQFVIKLNLEADFKNHKALIRHFTNHYMKHKTGKTTYTAFSNANSIIDVDEDMDYDNMQTW